MNKYNYLSFILILISFIFSIYDGFIYPRELHYDDYYPETKDKSFLKKITWYLSQFTYQKQILFLIYFYFKLNNYKNLDWFLKIIAPPMIIINIFYFKYLFPHYKKECTQNTYKLYELKFVDLFPHFLDTILIIIELWSLKNYNFKDIFLPIYFELVMLISVILNYKIRNVWTYTIVDLKNKKSQKMILEFIIYTHLLSYIIFKIKD
jgi:hypothetical protein